MLCAGNDFVLQVFAQVVEVVAVACHPNNQVAVFFGVLLGIAQGVGRYHVELYVVAIESEVGPDQRR